MITYVSFLRGVNMTGHNSIRMTDLASLYNDLGFINAETYIQSGNVIFNSDSKADVSVIASAIETAIRNNFGHNVPVMIRTLHELRNIMNINPYLRLDNFDPSKMAVIFLHEKASEAQVARVAGVDFPPDRFTIIGSEIFTYCPNGFGRTKIYTNFFEDKMKVTGTARNWKTISTILNIAENR